jgi:hypothetical protein
MLSIVKEESHLASRVVGIILVFTLIIGPAAISVKWTTFLERDDPKCFAFCCDCVGWNRFILYDRLTD